MALVGRVGVLTRLGAIWCVDLWRNIRVDETASCASSDILLAIVLKLVFGMIYGMARLLLRGGIISFPNC